MEKLDFPTFQAAKLGSVFQSTRRVAIASWPFFSVDNSVGRLKRVKHANGLPQFESVPNFSFPRPLFLKRPQPTPNSETCHSKKVKLGLSSPPGNSWRFHCFTMDLVGGF